MNGQNSFSGFSKKTVRFFQDLAKNNNKPWFDAHREAFESEVMAPSRAFVEALGAKLRTVVPHIVAIPKVNKSIFKIHRDTRFSLDPSPFKTNLGVYFWEGPKSRLESSGFYFHLEPPTLMLGGGFYMFPDQVLERFRRAAVSPRAGRELTAILAELARRGYEPGGVHYKRLPQGYDPGHPNAPLLKHNGLYVGWEGKIPPEFYSQKLVDFCFDRFRPVVPLHRWLTKALA
jgi:uncharacterized protein (TIGR02453 family)